MNGEEKIDWTNREFVLAAVSEDFRALEYASDELKDKLDIVRAAAINAEWIDDSATFDTAKAVWKAAVTKDGRALRYASPDMKKYYDVVLAAVTQNGLALEYASNAIRSWMSGSMSGWMSGWSKEEVKTVVMTAVTGDGMALEFAPKQQGDEEIVLAAVGQNPYAARFAEEWLKKKLLKENKVAPEDVEDSEEDALFFKLRF